MLSRIRAFSLLRQYAICLVAVALVALTCFLAEGLVGYHVAALVLLMTVSVLAMLFRIKPVLCAAALSALVWNFFFIPPVFTFHIGSAEDLLMFLMYFVVASVNAVLSLKVRQAEHHARDREQKQKAIELYNTVLSSLSHELRTPITTIMGAVDTLQDKATALSEMHRTELLGEIDTASARLDHQVHDLLGMGRLESGMLQPKRDWCDVNEVIGDAIRRLHPERDGRIVFHADSEQPLFKLDGGLLAHVLHNLLLNALQYTPADAIVHVEVQAVASACVITVADEGPGFPEAEMARAFDKFHRVPGTRTGGSGLGLSIVKGFVEAQGGTVQLQRNTPHGAVFTVSVPAETSYISNLKNE